MFLLASQDSVFVNNPSVVKVVWGVILIGAIAALIMYISFTKEPEDNQIYSDDDVGFDQEAEAETEQDQSKEQE
jgi:hypothetical protein